jgi:signal peptidase I
MSSTGKKDSVVFLLLSSVCIVAFLTGIVGGAWIVAGGICVYRLPTNSMSPTISTEDSFVVERFTYCFSQPKRGTKSLIQPTSYFFHSIKMSFTAKG